MAIGLTDVPPTDDGGICRQLAVKHGAAIHGVTKVINRPVHPNQGLPRVNTRIARQSYGAWMSDGPRDLVKWFINKVRRALSAPRATAFASVSQPHFISHNTVLIRAVLAGLV